MQCPVDQAQLVMAERQGVEIDYCPVCRGIWLDRGELDKILDRAAGPAAPTDPRAVPGVQTPGPPPGYDDRRYDGGRPERGYERDYGRGYDDDRRDPRYDPRRQAPGYGTPGHDPRRRKKKDSWLEDLFNF